MESNQIILVDENDVPMGTMEKLEAHKKGVLHRAYSIFIFNSKGELLLQKRALNKYHSGGLWTNTCCSHPKPGEAMDEAVHKRLKEEMGFDCGLKESFQFIYKTQLDNELTEYELDHVFIGYYDGVPIVDTNEATEWKYETSKYIIEDMHQNPEQYTVWFKLIFPKVLSYLKYQS